MIDSYTPITLDDVTTTPVTLRIETSYGRVIKVRVLPLTIAQWEEIGYDVESPPEPAQKNPQTLRVWRRHAEKAEEERNMRRVVYALEQGGNPLPGATLAEKAENWRKKADRGLTMSIWRFLRDAAEGDRARVIDGADTFQPDHVLDPADVPAERLDAEPMESAE